MVSHCNSTSPIAAPLKRRCRRRRWSGELLRHCAAGILPEARWRSFRPCDGSQLTLVPGVLQALSDIWLPMAVASNSSHARVPAALKQTGLSALFGERIHTPDIVGHPKPHPAVYLAAAASFGVAPGNCIAIEDSVTGATAAVAAGMCVLGFTGGGHVSAGQEKRLIAAGVHATFDDMRQLPALIQRFQAAP